MEIPGGMIDDGEDILTAAQREVQEETQDELDEEEQQENEILFKLKSLVSSHDFSSNTKVQPSKTSKKTQKKAKCK